MNNTCFFIILLLSAPLWAQEKEKAKDIDKNKVNFAGIPIVNYSDSYGTIVGLNSMMFFNLSKKDTISPSSVAGLGGGYSQNETWFIIAFTQLYIDEDRWRVGAGAGLGDINFQYFETTNEDDGGTFIDYNNVTQFGFLRALRQVVPHFYAGGVVKFQHTKTKFETGIDSTTNANGIGANFLYDTRDDVYNPARGWRIGTNYVANTKWMGSDEEFHSIKAYANYYRKINNRMILASRANIFAGLGNVPFTGQRSVGGKDIRGYTDGRYRANEIYSVQSEFRWNYYKRWGAVGFFGVAFTENPSSGLLPGGGAGIRFKIIRARNINIGLDYAIGKNDNGIYFRIGEAF